MIIGLLAIIAVWVSIGTSYLVDICKILKEIRDKIK